MVTMLIATSTLTRIAMTTTARRDADPGRGQRGHEDQADGDDDLAQGARDRATAWSNASATR